MRMPTLPKRLMTAVVAALVLVGVPLWAQAKKPRPASKRPAVAIPSTFRFPGWIPAAQARKLSGKPLDSYLGPRAAMVLQYGVKEIFLHRFKPATRTKRTAGKEIILEVFRMETADDAFGLFSVSFRASEAPSPILPPPNVSGSERAAFVKGFAYVNIQAKACEAAELEKIAAAAAKGIGLPLGRPPAGVERLPRSGLVAGSERYIRGNIAAGAESPLLNRDFWGFRTGESRAFAARYRPGDGKLIVVEFAEPPEGLKESVLALFGEYLEDVRQGDDFVVATDVAGGTCLFGSSGNTAALIIGEPDASLARERLSQALAHVVPPGPSEESGVLAGSPPAHAGSLSGIPQSGEVVAASVKSL
jgi:hypothetical protein